MVAQGKNTGYNAVSYTHLGEQRMKHEKSKNDAMRHELDHIDAKILNLLRENARRCV